mgnify:CR=1 FL=1
MNSNKISVIIPSFNRYNYLLNAIKSIQNQTYDNYKRGHRHQKCSNVNNLNNITALKKRYGEIFLKDTLRICEWCKEHYNPKRSEQKFCNQKCAITHLCCDKEKLKINGRKGFEVRSINNRSKNEILCSELCIKYFGQNDIQCNEKIFKDTNGNFWDCDIFIKSLKIAILWDGHYWHKGPNVSNKQKAYNKKQYLASECSTIYPPIIAATIAPML